MPVDCPDALWVHVLFSEVIFRVSIRFPPTMWGSEHISWLPLSVDFVNCSHRVYGETSFMFGISAVMRILYNRLPRGNLVRAWGFGLSLLTTGCRRQHVENKGLAAKLEKTFQCAWGSPALEEDVRSDLSLCVSSFQVPLDPLCLRKSSLPEQAVTPHG